MKINYRIITPLARYSNLEPLIEMLRPLKVDWHLIVDIDCPFSVSFKRDSDWIHKHVFPGGPSINEDACLARLNWFIQAIPLHDYDRYIFLNDDDGFEPGLLAKLDHAKGDVLICSLERGFRTPAHANVRHPATKLIAAPENMKVGKVSLEQLVITGRILKYCTFPTVVGGDGELIKRITTDHKTTYLPDACMWFNWLEPGRWNYQRGLSWLKPDWRPAWMGRI